MALRSLVIARWLEIFREGFNALHLPANDVHGISVPEIVVWPFNELFNFNLARAWLINIIGINFEFFRRLLSLFLMSILYYIKNLLINFQLFLRITHIFQLSISGLFRLIILLEILVDPTKKRLILVYSLFFFCRIGKGYLYFVLKHICIIAFWFLINLNWLNRFKLISFGQLSRNRFGQCDPYLFICIFDGRFGFICCNNDIREVVFGGDDSLNLGNFWNRGILMMPTRCVLEGMRVAWMRLVVRSLLIVIMVLMFMIMWLSLSWFRASLFRESIMVIFPPSFSLLLSFKILFIF